VFGLITIITPVLDPVPITTHVVDHVCTVPVCVVPVCTIHVVVVHVFVEPVVVNHVPHPKLPAHPPPELGSAVTTTTLETFLVNPRVLVYAYSKVYVHGILIFIIHDVGAASNHVQSVKSVRVAPASL